MDDLIRPMLATPGALPADDAAYAFETKWDGVRVIAYVRDATLRLYSRNDADVTAAYPELAPLAAALGGVPAVLDGEVVAFDGHGRVSFEALQPRVHLRDAAQIERLAARSPVRYEIFDLLQLDEKSTMDLPYARRRELLESLALSDATFQTPPSTVGGGAAALAAAVEQHTEGIVAKRLDSRYLPGRRSPTWLKIKNFRTQEVVIGGWTPGQGNRADLIGSLLLGVPGKDGLDYVGQVGTGFTRAALRDLAEELQAAPGSPFAHPLPSRDAKDARWVRPLVVGEVAFSEWTRDGRLRHPSWRGLRPDKSPGEVVPES